MIESFDPLHKAHNFIEIYYREILNATSLQSFFSMEQLLALCVDFFQAGSETTSNTLAFAILYMLYYPEVKVKVQAELENVVGKRLPRISDRPKLTFTEATINEVQSKVNTFNF